MQDNKQAKRQRQVHEAVQNGDMSKNQLYEVGQPYNNLHPLVLADEDEENDGVIAVVKDDISEHWNAGPNGTRQTIEKGHCGACGSNRLSVSVSEPAGAVMVSCPVCKRDDRGHGPCDEWEYAIGGEE